MSLARTTASSAIGASDTSIVVAAATGFAAGNFVRVDEELMKVTSGYVAASTTVPVIRGVDGTRAVAHAVTSSVVVGSGSDFANSGPQTQDLYPIAARARTITSYTADGAITLPTAGTDAVAILNGTAQWDMTLAAPGKDLDGSVLTVIGNGKAAHTITITAGLGNAGSGYTVMTFDGSGQCAVQLMAINEQWVPLPSPFSGTLTAIDVAVA